MAGIHHLVNSYIQEQILKLKKQNIINIKNKSNTELFKENINNIYNISIQVQQIFIYLAIDN